MNSASAESAATRRPGAAPLVLGLDVGTGKVAAVLTTREGRLQEAATLSHGAKVGALPPGRAEQDPARLQEAAWSAVERLSADLRSRVAAVGVTGQMHGLLLLDGTGAPVSNLVTWQDGRCLETPAFLERLRTRTGHALRTGYGCATLAWMTEQRTLPDAVAAACTLPDWMVALLSGHVRPRTDATLAASWALFDLAARDWDRRAVEAAAIPADLLPDIQQTGSEAGRLAPELARRLGLPAAIPVAAALGDNQASLFATLRDPEQELALTLGTGGQLSAVFPRGAPRCPVSDRIECRPYPDGRYALVAAALNGGAAWNWLAESAAAWLRDLGAPVPDPAAIFTRLNELGLAAVSESAVTPLFAGERWDPVQRGRIEGLESGGLALGPLARGVARGILTNLRDMLPADALAGRVRLMGSGNALRQNALLRHMAEETFQLPLVMPEAREEAAVGAAMLAARLL